MIEASRERALVVSRALGTDFWAGQVSAPTTRGRVEVRLIRFVDATDDTPAHVEVAVAGGRRTHFRIFNPPTLVPDPTGPITKEHADPLGRVTVRRYRHDPIAAVAEIVARNGGAIRRRRGRRGGRR